MFSVTPYSLLYFILKVGTLMIIIEHLQFYRCKSYYIDVLKYQIIAFHNTHEVIFIRYDVILLNGRSTHSQQQSRYKCVAPENVINVSQAHIKRTPHPYGTF